MTERIEQQMGTRRPQFVRNRGESQLGGATPHVASVEVFAVNSGMIALGQELHAATVKRFADQIASLKGTDFDNRLKELVANNEISIAKDNRSKK